MIFYDAKAIIKGGKSHPSIHGTVYLKQTKNGVLVTAEIYGLPTNSVSCKRKLFRIPYT